MEIVKRSGLLLSLLCALSVGAQTQSELTISGTRFRRNGAHFAWTGISFFKALHNPAFNRDAAARTRWLKQFQRYGINVLRVWGQWDSNRG